MKDLLFHACFPEGHEHYVPLGEVKREGIKPTTRSNHRYSNGGRVRLEQTERLRPANIPGWVNFNEAIGVDLFKRFSKSFCFPMFTNRILVFDSEVSLCIYDQAFYEDMKDSDEEAMNFDTGKSIEHWIRLYWKSMVTLKEYVTKRPFPKPEVLIFELIPRDIIQVCEE